MKKNSSDLSVTATILIVEDSITQAEKLKYILEGNGYIVKHSLNGSLALSLLDKYKPTLIISDIVMPEMNGYELCKHIKANKRTCEIPVFLVTALSATEDVLIALSCGADGFITKPYSEKYILKHIENFLEQKNMTLENRQDLIKNRSELFQIASNEPNRMISLMLSIYEAAVYRNNELIQTQDELVSLNEHLENLVIEKASELSAEISARVLTLEKDIAERKQAEERLIYVSTHDSLTNLYNRIYFENEISRLDSEKNLPLSIISLDVNGLKLINDSFGRVKGDLCLIEIADIIKSALPSYSVISRISGGEFGVILPKTDIKSSKQAVNKIMDILKRREENIYYLTVAFGCYSKTDINQNIQDILTMAENDMQKHKLYEESSARRNVINVIMKTLFEISEREMLHSERVSEMCGEIAFHMNFDKNEINKIKTAGLIHDIGKIGIEEKILNKVKRLEQEEWQELKKHPEIGWRILKSTTEFSELAQNILEHHERWDGKGYPKGIKGDEISKEARIINLVDSYDAMTNDRSYRNGLTKKEAIAEIIKCTGTQFDPEIVGVFIKKVLME